MKADRAEGTLPSHTYALVHGRHSVAALIVYHVLTINALTHSYGVCSSNLILYSTITFVFVACVERQCILICIAIPKFV